MARRRKQFGVHGLIAGILAFAVTQYAVRRVLLDRPQPKLQSQEFLQQVANETNRALPMLIDRDTELVSSVGLDGVFMYSYRLVNVSAADLDAERLIATLKPRVTKSACSTPATRDTFLKRGVTLRYSYASKDSAFIASFDVTPKDCGF